MTKISSQRPRRIDHGGDQYSFSQYHRQAWQSVLQNSSSRSSYSQKPSVLGDPLTPCDSCLHYEKEEEQQEPKADLKFERSLQRPDLSIPIQKKARLGGYDCFYGSLAISAPSTLTGSGVNSVTAVQPSRRPHSPPLLDHRHTVGKVSASFTLPPPRVPTTSTADRHIGQYQKYQHQHQRTIGTQQKTWIKRESVPSDFRPVYDLVIKFAKHNIPARDQLQPAQSKEGLKYGTEKSQQKMPEQEPKKMIMNFPLEADINF
jgi:hypothetical protein